MGRPNQRPVDPSVDRRAQGCARLAAQWAGRPSGRPDLRAELSVYLGRPSGRPVCSNGRIFDRWQSTDRSTEGLSDWQISLTASFWFGLYNPHFSRVLAKIFRADFSPFSGFKNKFSKEFKVPKWFIYLFLSVLLFSKKIDFWETCLLFFISISIWYFPKSFSLIKTLVFHTWAISSILIY